MRRKLYALHLFKFGNLRIDLVFPSITQRSSFPSSAEDKGSLKTDLKRPA
jgi:hypothetical protein